MYNRQDFIYAVLHGKGASYADKHYRDFNSGELMEMFYELLDITDAIVNGEQDLKPMVQRFADYVQDELGDEEEEIY